MADNPRIEELRRRIQKDPASIAFAQLGEEYRRAGRSREAIEICTAGLKHHPTYLSARVTLGRALLEVGELEQAEHELKEVLRMAPENLAALRGVAEALQRRGNVAGALSHYEVALALAPRDPDLQQTVTTLRGQVPAPAPPPAVSLQPEAASPSASQQPAEPPPTATDSATANGQLRVDSEESRAIHVLERWLDAMVEDRAARSISRATSNTSGA